MEGAQTIKDDQVLARQRAAPFAARGYMVLTRRLGHLRAGAHWFLISRPLALRTEFQMKRSADVAAAATGTAATLATGAGGLAKIKSKSYEDEARIAELERELKELDLQDKIRER